MQSESDGILGKAKPSKLKRKVIGGKNAKAINAKNNTLLMDLVNVRIFNV